MKLNHLNLLYFVQKLFNKKVQSQYFCLRQQYCNEEAKKEDKNPPTTITEDK